MESKNPARASLDRLCVDTLRTLAIDAVEQAKSGHPGMPMAMAPVVYALWQRHLRYDPSLPSWPDRDRFVLSAGHGSALLYALLHLCEVRAEKAGGREYAVTLDDIRHFRQLGGVCAGHPELGLASGIECTTGPLGQGIAMSVGMAIAGRRLGALYNQPERELFNHRIWALCGDGDLMEGLSSEAAAIAGHLKLGNLCWIYDSNAITIEGRTELAWSEDVAARFVAFGWRTLEVLDANDLDALDRAFTQVAAHDDRPTLVVVHSRIGYGAPGKEGTSSAHGEPLGEEELRGAKQNYGWPESPRFLVPEGVVEHFRGGIGARGRELRLDWDRRHAAFRQADPAAATQLDQMLAGSLPEDWDAKLPVFPADLKGVATRIASGKALNALAATIPWFLGGSADLAPSVKTLIDKETDLSAANPTGRNIRFGIREHAMGSIMNGLALSGLRPFGGTFLVFSDYQRPAIRLSALMELPVTWVFTHDSIFVGEDGPTHQPIEHVAALRAIPGLVVLRPADANETAEAWRFAAAHGHGPVALILSRQNLPVYDRGICGPASGLARGGYVLAEASGGTPRLILVGTGSEVAPCMEARTALEAEGIPTRVVSLPSWELFEKQDAAYRAMVLPPEVTARLTVEAGSPMGWERYAGPSGTILAMRGFGASAPAGELAKHFGFTAVAVAEAARALPGKG
jgi:transketolase